MKRMMSASGNSSRQTPHVSRSAANSCGSTTDARNAETSKFLLFFFLDATRDFGEQKKNQVKVNGKSGGWEEEKIKEK